jgi:hypothetical protein
MSIRLLSRAFGRGFVPRAALDMEALRIGAAMEHIKSRGNLDGFLAGRSERLALMSTAGRQGLVVWNKNRSRYELTSLGESRLGVSRTHVSDPSRSDRVVGPDSVRSRMKSRLLGAVAGAAACAGLIAWLPLGYSKAPLVPQASRNSVTVPAAGASPLPAPTEVTLSGQPALPKNEPSSATHKGVDDQGQLARSSSIDTSGEPQTHAATAEKPLSKKRGDALRSRKLAHSQKKTDRKTRPTDPDDGFGPPFTIGRLLGLERGTRLGFVEDDRRNTGRATQHGSPSWFFHW